LALHLTSSHPEPDFNNLRQDRRYKALVRKMKLPE